MLGFCRVISVLEPSLVGVILEICLLVQCTLGVAFYRDTKVVIGYRELSKVSNGVSE